jgi:hypothetical protein
MSACRSRPVVHPVTGHRDDVPALLQHVRNPLFVLRRDPGDDDAVVVQQRTELGVVGR